MTLNVTSKEPLSLPSIVIIIYPSCFLQISLSYPSRSIPKLHQKSLTQNTSSQNLSYLPIRNTLQVTDLNYAQSIRLYEKSLSHSISSQLYV
jgi:hypothetical protein